MKNIRVTLSEDATEVYQYLKKEAPNSKVEQTILNAVTQKIELIKSNPHYGKPIAKHLIPAEYKKKYEIINLFRVELPNYWRMLYTIQKGETKIEIVAFVLDIIDHLTYNKKFGYKRK